MLKLIAKQADGIKCWSSLLLQLSRGFLQGLLARIVAPIGDYQKDFTVDACVVFQMNFGSDESLCSMRKPVEKIPRCLLKRRMPLFGKL